MEDEPNPTPELAPEEIGRKVLRLDDPETIARVELMEAESKSIQDKVRHAMHDCQPAVRPNRILQRIFHKGSQRRGWE